MNNYDTMSVRDLVREIVREENLALDIGVTGDDWTQLKELKSALRKAVIREASVGTVRLRMDDGDSCWRGFRGVNDEEDLPDGDYDLIPKENP